MKRNQRTSAEAAELRRRAAERLNEKTAKTGLPRKTADLKRRLHELQVRQIELARQNEELRQAKQDGEDRYRALFENSLEAILLTVPDGRILAANPAACRLFGRTEAEICRLGRDGLVDPTDPRLAGALAERAQAGKAQREMMFVRNDGVRFPGEVSSGVFKDRNGLLRTSMVIHDITERKRTEDALRESETLFRSLGACLPLGVFLTDAAGHMVYSNPRCRALLGLTLMQAVGEGWARSLHPDDHGRTIQKWFAALREGKEFSDEFRIQNQGGVRWLSARTAPTLSEQGELTGHVATLEDITERKRTEEAARDSRRLLERTFVSLLNAIFVIDAGTAKILDCNPAASRIFGYSREEMLGKTTTFLHVNESALEEFRRCLHAAVDEQGFLHVEFSMKRKDGTVFPTEHNVMPIEDDRGQCFAWVSVVRDITERKRVEEQLSEYQRQLRSLASELSIAEQRERRRVATLLHDDLIQSLALCQIKLGGLREGVPTPDLAASVEAIREAIGGVIQHARDLTMQLSPPILHELGLEAALDWLAEQFTTQHGLQCRFEGDGQLKPLDEDVGAFLFSATRELLVNVVKHAKADHASIRAQREGESIRIAVEDDGVGFDTSRIGASFGKTTGYGLFNLRERLAHLGGRLELRSEPGRGTCVGLVVLVKRTGSA